MCLNQNGFIQASLLILLPLLIGTIIFSMMLYFQIEAGESSQRLCYKSLVATEKSIRTHLRSLFRLNPQAQRLRVKAKNAKKLLLLALSSGNPTAVATAKSYQLYVRSRQLILNSRQKIILQKISLAAWNGQDKIQSLFKNTYQNRLNYIRHNSFRPILIPFPPFTLSPNYKVLPPVRNSLQLYASWEINIHPKISSLFNSPTLTFITNSNIGHEKGHCSTTLRKEQNQWYVTLNKGKYL